jgi:hypothetical protein
MWPTPQAHKTTESGEIVNADGTPWNGLSKPHSKNTGRPITTALADAVKMWPTPTTNDSVGAGYQRANGNHYFTLPGAVGATKHLPPEMEEKRMKTWPTPTAQDAKNNGAPAQMERNTKPLNAEVGGSLNPTWVEWLMGWPLGWTDCAASAMAKFQPWCHSHGISCPPNPLRTEN